MAQSNYWFKAGAFALFIRFGTMLFGLGSFVLLIQSLEMVDFGQWHLFIMITGLIEVARNGLIQNGLVKHLVGEEGKTYRTIASASLALNGLFSLSFMSVIFVMAPYLAAWLKAPQLEDMLHVYLITLGLMIPFSQSEFFNQSNFEFKGTFFGYVARLGTLFAFILFSVLTKREFNLIELAWVHMGGALFGAITMAFFARQYWKLSRTLSWTWVNKLFQYGKYAFGTNLSAVLLNNIDTWMLSGIINPAAAASYGAALRVNQMVEVPTGALAATVFPQSAHRHKKGSGGGARYLYEKSVGSLLAVIIPGILFVLLVPEWIITLLAGKKYIDVAPVLSLTILFGLFIPFTRQFGTILDSIGKPALNFAFIMLGAIVNVGLNYLFIKILNMGLMGAAVATLCTHACTFIATQIMLRNMLQVSIPRIFRYAFQFYPQMFNKLKSMIAGYRGRPIDEQV
ncbi:MAG: oligosaccharide flippase family protein [Bacteroidia bacterium]